VTSFGRIFFLSVTACVLWRRMRVNFGAFNAAASLCALLFLAEQGRCTFVLSFVLMLLQKWLK